MPSLIYSAVSKPSSETLRVRTLKFCCNRTIVPWTQLFNVFLLITCNAISETVVELRLMSCDLILSSDTLIKSRVSSSLCCVLKQKIFSLLWKCH
jgi:hypothetical protein